MNSKKRLLSVLFISLLILVLVSTIMAGCSSSSSSTSAAAPTTTASTTAATTSTAPTTSAQSSTSAPATSPTAAATKTLLIGGIMGMTGPLSVPSTAITRGWQIYADYVNSQGGVKIGNDTYKIQFDIQDDQGTAEGATTAATKLVTQDHVKFIIGAMLEAEVQAIYQVTGPAGVFYGLANINIPHHVADVHPNEDLKVRLAVSPDDNQALDLDYIKAHYPNVKNITVVYPDLGYEGMIAELKTEAAARGMSVIATVPWQFGITDYMPTGQKVAASNPDLVWCMNSGNAPDVLLACRQSGFKGPFVSNSPLGADVIAGVVKDPSMLNNIIVNSPDVNDLNPASAAVKAAWEAKWPNDPFITDSIHAYDMPWVLVQGMQKAGSIDPHAVLAALESMSTPGDLQTNEGPGYMGGKDSYGANLVLYRPFPITVINNGQLSFAGFFNPVAK